MENFEGGCRKKLFSFILMIAIRGVGTVFGRIRVFWQEPDPVYIIIQTKSRKKNFNDFNFQTNR